MAGLGLPLPRSLGGPHGPHPPQFCRRKPGAEAPGAPDTTSWSPPSYGPGERRW